MGICRGLLPSKHVAVVVAVGLVICGGRCGLAVRGRWRAGAALVRQGSDARALGALEEGLLAAQQRKRCIDTAGQRWRP